MEKIIEQEKIEVKEEEIDERLKKSVNGELKEEKLARIKKNLDSRGELNTIKARMREEKVINLLYQSGGKDKRVRRNIQYQL
jgi:FKBP-type peptidyl-prolyl cis-trans isomerase (trigger factor)